MAYNPYDKSNVYQRRINVLETIIKELETIIQKQKISELQNKHECKHWNGSRQDADNGEEEQSDEGA